MKSLSRSAVLFTGMALLIACVGIMQSWSLALAIVNLCIISAVMALGVNIQWGYAGLFNVGIMGFAALGGIAAVLVSQPPVAAAWRAGGGGIGLALVVAVLTIAAMVFTQKRLAHKPWRKWLMLLILVVGFVSYRALYDPASSAIEAVDAAKTGYLGGLGLPIILSWLVGGLFAAGAAWVVGRVALGLRSDYLAIATLGISEIIIALLKNEDWLTRGVKNVSGLSRPVPYEVNLQNSDWFVEAVATLYQMRLPQVVDASYAKQLNELVVSASGIVVKLSYCGLFALVLLLILWLCNAALNSPWGRMMRAIRDNEVAANAMGKDVVKRHRQVFILGSAIVGIAGAMLTTLDGQFTPGSYNPLRFTFLIWVMVIVGGSGNNLGAVLGGFVVWFFWIEAEPLGLWFMDVITAGFADDNPIRVHFLESAQHMRLFVMGLILLLVMRFSPAGLLPEAMMRKRR